MAEYKISSSIFISLLASETFRIRIFDMDLLSKLVNFFTFKKSSIHNSSVVECAIFLFKVVRSTKLLIYQIYL